MIGQYSIETTINLSVLRVITQESYCNAESTFQSFQSCELATTTLKPVYTTEKLGTDPSRKEYGPRIFARVNYVCHVFEDWHGLVFFQVLGL